MTSDKLPREMLYADHKQREHMWKFIGHLAVDSLLNERQACLPLLSRGDDEDVHLESHLSNPC